MSDDGYYAYSPYDEFEDMLYDADPGPELADDLAEHTLHSPVYQDDPGYELLDYYSDWDYYSDDFYDDDPALMRRNAQIESSSTSKTRARLPQSQLKRAKKRKLAETEDIPELDLGEREKLRDCLKGTVWAQPGAQDRPPLYHQGQHQKVALLKNWKDKFGVYHDTFKGCTRAKLEQDESWANDMSLADMGLQNARDTRVGASADTEATGIAEDEGDEEDVDEEDDMEEVDMAAMLESETMGGALDDDAAEADVVHADFADVQEGDAKATSPLRPIINSMGEGGPKKKRKTTRLPTPPSSEETMSTNVTDDVKSTINGARPGSGLTERGRTRDTRTAKTQQQHDPAAGDSVVMFLADSGTSKKRKALEEAFEDGGGITRSTVASRSKRAVSQKINQERTAAKTAPDPPATRSSRRKGK